MNAPKVGRVELPQVDVLQRVKAKHSFAGHSDNILVFASERKVILPRKSMTFLGGDSHFNKWVVPLIPIASLHKVDVAIQRAIFADQDDAMTEEVEGSESVAPEVIIATGLMVPFPQDLLGD